MRRGFVGLVLVLGIAGGSSADAGDRVAVASVRVGAGLAKRVPSLQGVIYPRIRAELSPRFSLATGEERDAAFASLGIAEADLEDDIGACRRFAAALGADRLLFLRADSFGDRIGLTLLVLDPERSEYVGAGSVRCDGPDEAPKTIRGLLVAAGLAEKRPSPRAPPRPPPGPPPVRSGTIDLPADPLLELYPTEDAAALLALKRRDRELEPEELRAIPERVAAAKAHLARLRAEPDYREEWTFRTRISQDPVLREYALAYAFRRPWFVVGVGRKKAPDPTATAERLREFSDFFRARFAPEEEFPLDGPLTVLRFEDRRMLEAYRQRTGDYRDLDDCYRIRDQWLLLSEPSDDRDERGHVQHLATWALAHAITRATLARDLDEEVAATDDATLIDVYWLNRGLPALLAAARPAPGGGGDLAEPERLLAELRESRELGIEPWALPEILSTRSELDLRVRANPRRLYTFDTFAGLFCRFLWEEHRDRLLACVRKALHGRFSPDDVETLLRGENEDLGPLVAEWEAWIGKRR